MGVEVEVSQLWGRRAGGLIELSIELYDKIQHAGDRSNSPKSKGAIRKLPPNELEITNFPQSEKATEVGTVPKLAARLTPLISLVYNKTRQKS
ncbi:MAG: hypothetical protein JGK28_21360 [Microcoleus sp. PH2017_07_MST_O_A]|uniref:hypothetical protein n=1 Tax=unclassified Microcoleus TaxID=2642155 RepID=UPI001DDF46AE|nr:MULTISPECIES: hypothetical protein [unclassified Microcoleus]MCC3420387.1 hypothetical protein [Microcoleus sp. PH2017_07_MST_O_A]MCC3443228.1 hypothetical protein [Microcoleus sp. PH2017_03_ELD_O_A]MCC3495482.1 hypothetical protein [Microcoleus sp. PH2017_15_JOR_U_A]MCC3512052.1 hypothetical protein [Microcoleus sp. PH2017_17_BER_D_A]TAE70358.1 MAG: hypothetical protein EAZ86_06255 [Oscillatoriales cyanobacterium]